MVMCRDYTEKRRRQRARAAAADPPGHGGSGYGFPFGSRIWTALGDAVQRLVAAPNFVPAHTEVVMVTADDA
jgi:hypothetical protein